MYSHFSRATRKTMEPTLGPVHSEDAQPNEDINKRRGQIPPLIRTTAPAVTRGSGRIPGRGRSSDRGRLHSRGGQSERGGNRWTGSRNRSEWSSPSGSRNAQQGQKFALQMIGSVHDAQREMQPTDDRVDKRQSTVNQAGFSAGSSHPRNQSTLNYEVPQR
jgi:hypothetical protein